jgi:hypothetical protein
MYTGREYLANVSLSSEVSPLRIHNDTIQGPVLGPFVKQRLANMTQDLLVHGGGNLINGLSDARYLSGDIDDSIASVLQVVLEQLGEAYFSVMRQSGERSNIYTGGHSKGIQNGSRLHLYVTVVRLGGARYVWLVVLCALLLGTIVGMVQMCAGKTVPAFEAQNVVELLRSTLQIETCCDTSRVWYRDGKLRTEEDEVLTDLVVVPAIQPI